MYFKRNIDLELFRWSEEKHRKPLLLRGARQVGKSSAVKALSSKFKYFLEVNFEENPQAHILFEGNLSPQELCENLAALFQTPVIAGETLVFLDEIQTCIPAISSLRFFYEKYPELHVIAAGSLLEFALSELPSFGVGRVRSMFVYPFSFDEFLTAIGEQALVNAKQRTSLQNPFPAPIHDKTLNLLKRFILLGGMPEVVALYAEKRDLQACQRSLDDLIISIKADFTKYKKKVPAIRLTEVFESATQQMGGKFKYTNITTEANHKQIKEALDLLIMAGLVITVTHSSSNGIPLGAEIDTKKRKLLLFDTGIFQRLLGLTISELLFEEDSTIINKGSIAELYVGLELLKSASCYQQQALYYWHRETSSGNAEVDYVVQKENAIIPIEVKSSKKGSMQSMHQFLKEKNKSLGIRFSLENYSHYSTINVIPLYAVSNWNSIPKI